MCTELSTSPNRKRRILWTLKVWRRIPPSLRNLWESALTLLVLPIVRRLSEALAQVKDEQSYIVVRERVHRNTAESTNARVKWWSIFQLAVLIGEGVFQVWWLKRFFEVSQGYTIIFWTCTDHSVFFCRSSGLFNFYVRCSERELVYYRSRAIISLLFSKRNPLKHCLHWNDMLRAGMVLYDFLLLGKMFNI